MKKIIIGAIILSVFARASAGVFKYGTVTREYTNGKVVAIIGSEIWKKDIKTGKTSYNGPTVNWSQDNDGTSIYKTPSINLEKGKNSIIYSTETIKYEKKGNDLIYTTPTTTLIIGKDKIKYTTPTETKEIDGGDWKVTTATEEYSN